MGDGVVDFDAGVDDEDDYDDEEDDDIIIISFS